MQPHRGVLILVFGILGLVMSCPFFGAAAWIMGNADLADMDAGSMDPEGHGMTQAGKVCGIISVVLSMLVFIPICLFIMFTLLRAGA